MLSSTTRGSRLSRLVTPARQCGFTLLELMTAVMVVAVLTAITVPMYTSYVRNQRVKTAAFDLVYALTLARSEALKRNAPVEVAANADGWRFGWSVATTGGTPVTLFSHEAPTYLDSGGDPASFLTFTPVNGNAVTYNGSGRLTTPVATITIASASGSTTEIAPRCISIDLSGLPRSTKSTTGTCP